MVFSVLEVFKLLLERTYLVRGFDYTAGNGHFEVSTSWLVKDNQVFYAGFTLEKMGFSVKGKRKPFKIEIGLSP